MNNDDEEKKLILTWNEIKAAAIAFNEMGMPDENKLRAFCDWIDSRTRKQDNE